MSEQIRERLTIEAKRTKPDYIAYIPEHYDEAYMDSHNEHFLVFEGPEGILMAVWTQSRYAEDQRVLLNRIAFSKSPDDGVTWQRPLILAGPELPDKNHMARWAFPMVSASGRIYILYNRFIGKTGWIDIHTGTMEGIYSDNLGDTWSAPQKIAMPVSIYDDPEGEVPAEWIVWQKPVRDLEGKYFAGYTHWIHPSASMFREWSEIPGWTWVDSVCSFMRFLNIDENPEPKDIRIEYSAWGEKALRVPHYIHPEMSVAQEPSVVRLPDNRLFCVMRTCSGCIWWSESKDDGRNWCTPRPLLYRDFGKPVLNPVASCPIYPLADGRYILFHHNNRGGIQGPNAEAGPRRPSYVSLGEFRTGADQPLWFSPPKLLMDTEEYCVNGRKKGEDNALKEAHLSMYASFISKGEENILWYPDRKFFLLGKKIVPEFLGGLSVPE